MPSLSRGTPSCALPRPRESPVFVVDNSPLSIFWPWLLSLLLKQCWKAKARSGGGSGHGGAERALARANSGQLLAGSRLSVPVESTCERTPMSVDFGADAGFKPWLHQQGNTANSAPNPSSGTQTLQGPAQDRWYSASPGARARGRQQGRETAGVQSGQCSQRLKGPRAVLAPPGPLTLTFHVGRAHPSCRRRPQHRPRAAHGGPRG